MTGSLAPAEPPGRRPDSNQRDHVDLRLVPIAVATWVGAWLGTSGLAVGWWILVGLAPAIGLAAVLRRSAWLAAVLLTLLVAAGLGGLAVHRLTTGPIADLARGQAVVDLEVEVSADPQLREEGSRSPYLVVRTQALTVEGRGARWQVRSPVLLVVTGDSAIADWLRHPVGERVRSVARLALPDPGAEVAAVVRVRESGTVVATPSDLLRTVERVRSGLRASVAGRAEEPRALVPALVLGDTSAMTPELTTDFRTTGLAHLTAVSGANLTLLLAFVLGVARWTGVRGWWLRGLGLVCVAVFVALCRTEPSVLRAAAMGLVTIAALGAGGRRRGLRQLSAAVIVLALIDPYLGRSWGFALSVLASAGIIWWAGRWSEAMLWLPRPIAEAVAVPLAAQLATTPVVAALSGAVSVAGVVTNALAGPIVGPATVLGFAAAGASLVSAPLAAVAGFGAAGCAQVIIWVAQAGAELPGASWRWPAAPVALLVLLVGCVAVAVVMPGVLRRWWLVAAAATILVLGLLNAPVQPGWPPRGWVLLACDVGQGDGILVRAGPDQAMVVDAGPDPAAMDRCLDQSGVSVVPVLVLTHFHADHVDGLPGVGAGRSVGEIWVSPFASPAAEAGSVAAWAAAQRAAVRSPPVGEVGRLGSLTWEVIGPIGRAGGPPGAVGDAESATENDASLVLRVVVDGVAILLTGDVEPDGQARLLRAGVDLRADILKIPHHGSARQDPAFFAATGARVAIASAALDNDYGHPAPRTLDLAASLGMAVLRTDQQGSVAVVLRDGQLSAVTQRTQ